MLSENYFVSISGPPLSNNTAIAKDVGVYEQTLYPVHSTANIFKKSSVPRGGLAVSGSHVFAAQDDKSTVHIYSRLRSNHEATITFQEKIRSVSLRDDVLILGTAEGRIILWEICTGRQITTPACHVQAVTTIVSTRSHFLTGSEDSNVLVWQIPQLLEIGSTAEHEPEKTLSNHRGAITSLALSQSTNPDTSICISASKDKSCIIWNYQQGVALRTLLLPSAALCLCLDPCARAFYGSSEDGTLFAVELFGEKALLGARAEASSTAVQVSSPFGTAPQGPNAAQCLALSYDGSVLLSGHPKGQVLRWDLGSENNIELANLNAAVSNLMFLPPLQQAESGLKCIHVVKPFLGSRQYTFTSQLETDIYPGTRLGKTMASDGFQDNFLERAVESLQAPQSEGVGSDELRQENEKLWEIINEQRALQKITLERYAESKAD